jgi:hypothetical protein
MKFPVTQRERGARMNRLIKLLQTDESYQQEVSRYGKTDGIIAIALFVLLMLVYYWLGSYQANTGIYLGVPVNLSFIALCLVLTFLRKQGISSLGFRRAKAGRSALTGLILGILLVLGNVVFGLGGGSIWAPVEIIITKFVYYLVIIALTEEIVFRGYIQTRIFGLLRSNITATLLAAVMFTLSHIPYQMAAAGMNLSAFLQTNGVWFIFLLIWHLVFTYLYRKYNSILAPTLFHALMDWGNSLFV